MKGKTVLAAAGVIGTAFLGYETHECSKALAREAERARQLDIAARRDARKVEDLQARLLASERRSASASDALEAARAQIRLMGTVSVTLDAVPGEESPVLSPPVFSKEAIETRIKTLLGAYRSAREQKDRPKMLTALAELNALGEPAYPSMIGLWPECVRSVNKRMGMVSQQAFLNAFRPEFLIWMLSRPDLAPLDPDIRTRAIYSLMDRSPAKVLDLPLPIMLEWKDEHVLNAMFDMIAKCPDPRVARTLVEIAKRHSIADVRRSAAIDLGGWKEEEIREALEEIASGDPDPDVRKAAEMSLGR